MKNVCFMQQTQQKKLTVWMNNIIIWFMKRLYIQINFGLVFYLI